MNSALSRLTLRTVFFWITGAVTALLVTVLWLANQPVAAQESPSTTASMAVNANAVTTEGSPQSTEGLVVFVVVLAVIVIGAVVVFYRGWRRKGAQSNNPA